jgi:hypothetical protein
LVIKAYERQDVMMDKMNYVYSGNLQNLHEAIEKGRYGDFRKGNTEHLSKITGDIFKQVSKVQDYIEAKEKKYRPIFVAVESSKWLFTKIKQAEALLAILR